MDSAIDFEPWSKNVDSIGEYIMFLHTSETAHARKISSKMRLDENGFLSESDISIIITGLQKASDDKLVSMYPDKCDDPNLFSMIKNEVFGQMSKRNGQSQPFKNDRIFGRYKKIFDSKGYPYLYNWLITSLSVPIFHSLGDTIGYHDGKWEFNHGSENQAPEYVNILLYEFIDLGGINDMSIKNWKCSDDTIMYMATMKTLYYNTDGDFDSLGKLFQKNYVDIQSMIYDRHPGTATMNSLDTQKLVKWDKLPYDPKVIGAGPAMRSGFIGVMYQNDDDTSLKKLIEVCIISSIITHNSATAIMGSIVAAYFTSLAMRKVSINKWPHKLIKLIKSDFIDNAISKIKPNDYIYYQRDRIQYLGQWEKYVKLFFDGTKPRLDIKGSRNLVERYRDLAANFSKGCDIPGSCGDDCLIIAYDSILRCNGSLEKILVYSILHPGDSDTVGSIAFSWFGAYYNSIKIQKIVEPLADNLEYIKLLQKYQKFMFVALIRYFFTSVYHNIAVNYIESMQ